MNFTQAQTNLIFNGLRMLRERYAVERFYSDTGKPKWVEEREELEQLMPEIERMCVEATFVEEHVPPSRQEVEHLRETGNVLIEEPPEES